MPDLRSIDPGEARALLRERIQQAQDGERAELPEFAHARLADMRLEVSAMLVRPSFHGSELVKVSFEGGNLDGLSFAQARLTACDLSQLSASRLYAEGAAFRSCRLMGSYLRHAHLKAASFEHCDLTQADLASVFAVGSSWTGSTLSEATFDLAWLDDADFSGARCLGTVLRRAHLRSARFTGAQLTGADLSQADLRDADFDGCDLSGVCLAGADLRGARIRDGSLAGADLSHANLSGADLRRTDLRGAKVYGVSAWDVQLQGSNQEGLLITPPADAAVAVDDLEVAQFVYLLSQNPKIRRVIDTVTSRVALILGRFTPERKPVLDALRDELRQRQWVPILFDFDKPTQRDFTETILTLAGLSRFVIADITNPSSSPLELQATVPNYMIPFVPIIERGQRPFAMFRDLQHKHAEWVLQPLSYGSVDQLRRGFDKAILAPALARHAELMARRQQVIATRDIGDYL